MNKCVISLLFMSVLLSMSPSMTAHGLAQEKAPAGAAESFDRVQTSFVLNTGQIDNKEAVYFARLLTGYIYIDKQGIITHTFSSPDKNKIRIQEICSQKKISLTPHEPPPDDAIRALKDKGQSVGTNYYRLSYGVVADGVELHLLAFIDNLEKIFIVSPGADPEKIIVTLKGAEGLKVSDAGTLEILTQQGTVTFSRPNAYQFVGEERKPVDVAYSLRMDNAYGFKLGSYDRTKPLFIAPLVPPFLLPVR